MNVKDHQPSNKPNDCPLNYYDSNALLFIDPKQASIPFVSKFFWKKKIYATACRKNVVRPLKQ